MTKRIELAVTAWASRSGWQAAELCGQAEVAESMGFHSFWLPENHFGDQRSIPSPLTLLAAVAARTDRIKLGSTSYLLTIRHPLQAAEEVAVLDQLSSGRVILGVGRGVQNAMFQAFELPTKDKRKRFQKNLDIMLNAWSGSPILEDEDGKPVFLAPLPVQRPYPTIWVAAFGPLALKQAGNLGMPYLASPIETLATLKDNYQLYHNVVEEAGLEPVKTIPVMRTIFITDNKTLAAKVKSALDNAGPHTMRDEKAGVDDWVIVGDNKFVFDKLQEYAEQLDISHLIARGRIPGIDNETQITSHEKLISIVNSL
ncbi:MAG: LLM class flavin-dependent oxidoreductase [bacterium]|nr:LLM class flavin-dependent oxidoreductase [Gammaproteobacteria bacterium]HIL97486.1 LLM class flavin-dependent oxidoreductase [Pseudomonadales bacterium]